jgi:hypothetical protein
VSEIREVADRMRAQAARADKDCPGMQVGGHLEDAAALVEAGNTEGAKRHLRVAAGWLTPRNLYRHGLMTDKEHQATRSHLDLISRHLAGVADIEDMNAPASTPAGRPSGTANGPSEYVSRAGGPLPARSWIKAGGESAGLRLLSNADGARIIENEPGYLDGLWDAL